MMSYSYKLLITVTALVLLGVGFFLPVAAFSADSFELDESGLIEIGRRIYQKGEMADGSPVKAFVLGDVEVTGNQFTCLNCHRRSGLGGPEGTKNVLPTNGALLLMPRADLYMERPAYTLQSFTEAMSLGVNPKGVFFDPIMPVYELPALENKALFAYLKNLSNDYSPGLTEDVLHIATVVGKDVDPQLKKEMLIILNTFFNNKNALSRNQKERFRAGPFYRENTNKAYRRWMLHTWELSGPAESWPAQLEKYYRQQPVFAMVSGLVAGDWQPIHAFCRSKGLPCLLPNTDLPAIEEPTDFYTLYFSKGLTLEALVLDSAISANKQIGTVLQVSRQGLAVDMGARTLSAKLNRKGIKTENVFLEPGITNWQSIQKRVDHLQPKAIVLWLDGADLKKFADESILTQTKIPIYISSSLLNGKLDLVPAIVKKHGKAVHPFFLPKEHKDRLVFVTSWMKANNILMTNPRIQEQTYYACLLLSGGLGHIKRNFYREYLLDMLDHADNMVSYSGSYPRLSFGPEQRFLAKGAYVIDLDTEEARWVVPGR